MLTRTRTQNNQLLSPFLRLPAEVRNFIYDCVFADDTIRVDMFTRSAKLLARQHNSPLALLQTCRQSRHEARQSFYANITFDFGANILDNMYMMKFERDTCSSIRSIRIPTWLVMRIFGAAPNSVIIEHYRNDFQGKLVGLENIHATIPEALAKRLKKDEFESLTSRVFGKEGLRLHIHLV